MGIPANGATLPSYEIVQEHERKFAGQAQINNEHQHRRRESWFLEPIVKVTGVLKSPGDRLTLINARIDRKRVPLRTIHPFAVHRPLDSPWEIAEI